MSGLSGSQFLWLTGEARICRPVNKVSRNVGLMGGKQALTWPWSCLSHQPDHFTLPLMMARTLSLATLIFATSTLACAQEPPPYVPPAFVTSGSPEFDAWRTRFAYRAVQVEKKDRAIVEATLTSLTPNPEVKRLNEVQPEFTRPVWAYIASAVSPSRVTQGRTLFARHRDALLGMSTTLGVPTEYAIAIWGLESGYGADKGSSDVVRSLASFAYQGRRTVLGETELLAVFDILARGDATRATLIGSWAGAMGHTQFMPSSFLSKAVDGDNDGKRDIWNNPVDALASTLTFLGRSGWKRDEPWGYEVSAPTGFDWSQADGTMRPLSFWTAAGVTRLSTAPQTGLPSDPSMRLLAPAGAGGAVFLVGNNFDAIRSYNASDSYSLSIALLGDQIAGRGALPTRWPTTNPPLGRTDATQLQGLLLGMGYQIGTPDGQVGPKTRAALQAFQKSQNLLADGYPSASALAAVRAGAARAGISWTPSLPVPSLSTGTTAPPPPTSAPTSAPPRPAATRSPPIPTSRTDPNYAGPPPVKMKW
jgi:membrane-bound lytic murein transglycosylase B